MQMFITYIESECRNFKMFLVGGILQITLIKTDFHAKHRVRVQSRLF